MPRFRRSAAVSALLLTAAVEVPLSAAIAPTWPACANSTQFPGNDWGKPNPRGWNATKLAEAHALWDKLDSAAVVIVHRGQLVAAWGEPERNFTAQSIRKALISSLVGIAARQNQLRLSDTLADLGIDDHEPGLTSAERQATVRDLLMSRSGIYHSALYEVGGWKKLRGQLAARKAANPSAFAPGSYWVYNNWDFNALGTIVEQKLGEPIGPAFQRYIASPIGMQDFAPSNVEYTHKTDATERRFGNVSDHRAYVFDISTRDLARYGLLYLNCGRWGGRQILPSRWVLSAITGVDTRIGRGADEQDTEFGDYGYLWQIDRPGSRRLSHLDFREPVYMASGNRGHFMLVAPFLDLVIAHQVATVGGVSSAAQQKRFLEGSPEVAERDLERLFAAIIAAHPKARTAWLESAPGQ